MVCNLTQSQFSEHGLDILALGPKFVLPPKCVPVSDVIASVEAGLQKSDNANLSMSRDQIHSSAANIVSRAKSKPQLSSPRLSLPVQYFPVIKGLKDKAQVENLAYVSADKGSKTVIMDKTEYIQKMRAHFQTSTMFVKSTVSQNQKLYVNIKSVLCSFMSAATILSILPSVDRAPLPNPYALVKIHKPSKPIRVITPMYSTVSYNVSKCLDQMLKPAVSDLSFCISNIGTLVQEMRNLHISPTLFMASIDVTALFDNVDVTAFLASLPDLLSSTESRWRYNIPSFKDASIQDIVKLFDYILHNSIFRFEKSILCQVFGVAMGNPLSVSVSDLYLGALEESFMSLCPASCKPVFYRWYIDDIILIFDGSVEKLHEFLEFVHSQLSNTKIRFTYELEVEGVIPFLDISITRKPDSLCFTVFRKPTHSNRYISNCSFVPLSYIKTTLKTLRNRALSYCLDMPSLTAEFEFLTDVFVLKNNYPEKLVARFFSLKNCYATCANLNIISPKIFLPYFGSEADRLASFLKSVGFKIFFRPPPSLNSLLYKPSVSHYKAEHSDRCNVVYLLGCSGVNCQTFYVGQTTRIFRKRLQEHIKAVHSKSPDSGLSAISLHARSTGHAFDFIRYLDIARNFRDLVIKEALYIHANRDKICNSRSVESCAFVSPHWLPCLPCLSIAD